MITNSFFSIFFGTMVATCLSFAVVLSIPQWQAWMLLSVFPAAITSSLLTARFAADKTPNEIVLGTAFGFAAPIVICTFPASYIAETQFIPPEIWAAVFIEEYIVAVVSLGIGLLLGLISNAIVNAKLV